MFPVVSQDLGLTEHHHLWLNFLDYIISLVATKVENTGELLPVQPGNDMHHSSVSLVSIIMWLCKKGWECP